MGMADAGGVAGIEQQHLASIGHHPVPADMAHPGAARGKQQAGARRRFRIAAVRAAAWAPYVQNSDHWSLQQRLDLERRHAHWSMEGVSGYAAAAPTARLARGSLNILTARRAGFVVR